ncbi:TIM barrel protein [Cellulophaga sp. 20_2_10]|uniref:hydroxypyruvate isomerase family protein n=1 Tax=Cellulophaga sp. 20_2_10 TaxID=2942476 RepID=UPI00201A742C|nr:TIM barrel protein [Cellulophaga sp. 20_2_10]MCL5245312.1 TIM barrel protein [Cellulophaga sp. 20_2_10]
MRNNIKHSVCQWCFNDTPLEDFLIIIKDLGVTAIDLIGPKDWPLLAKHGVHCAMCNGAEISLEQGWNNPENHHQLTKNYTELIPQVAAVGYTNLICFSGNSNGLDKETGMQNCVDGLSKILPLAEKHNVVLQMELFNQIDHPDYMCDSSEWGVNLCKKLDSSSFKLLFDIYHMQIQEGDIIRTIKKNHQYFGHYHTAGVPGRNEIDHTQEINYSAVMKAIVDTGFKGYVAQEFMPLSKNKIQSLRESFLICDV